MIKILWKGKIGYGDIVSPICYAHNVSHKLNTSVHLQFQWGHGPEHKFCSSDPEALWQRADIIASHCVLADTDVTVAHKFNDPIYYNHSNYDWDVVGNDVYHNYWYPHVKNTKQSNIVVVNSTEGNTVTLKQYGRPWKDPVAHDWPLVCEMLKERWDVVIVDYRTPLEEMIALLQSAAGFVGYHGTAAWVAKFVHTPSILFARGGKLTRRAFSYAFIDEANSIVTTIANADTIFDDTRQVTDKFVSNYEHYIPSPQFQAHLCYE